MMIFFLVTTMFLLFMVTCLSVYMGFLLYRLGRKVLTLETQVEESLDLLEVRHQKLFHLANTPVLHDEPIIREVLSEIKRARDTVLLVANKLVAFSDSKDDNDTDRDDDDDTDDN